jgi:sulfite oxidase
VSYDRNHGPIQHIAAEEHVVKVDGLVKHQLELTAADLARDFPQHKVTCALQCAGNRRHSMRTRVKEVCGVDWFDAALMNCVFEGPRLRDILLAADTAQEDSSVQSRHVQFASVGTATQDDDYYGGSIPLDRAMDPDMDVIMALRVRVESWNFSMQRPPGASCCFEHGLVTKIDLMPNIFMTNDRPSHR